MISNCYYRCGLQCVSECGLLAVKTNCPSGIIKFPSILKWPLQPSVAPMWPREIASFISPWARRGPHLLAARSFRGSTDKAFQLLHITAGQRGLSLSRWHQLSGIARAGCTSCNLIPHQVEYFGVVINTGPAGIQADRSSTDYVEAAV